MLAILVALNKAKENAKEELRKWEIRGINYCIVSNIILIRKK